MKPTAETLIGIDVRYRPFCSAKLKIAKVIEVFRFHMKPVLVLDNGDEESPTACCLLTGELLPPVH